MKTIAVLALLIIAGSANAGTTVLDPGNGRQYLSAWCGGQSINEYAVGWNADSTAKTLVSVSTRCALSGRGGMARTYYTCWYVDFNRDGTIAAQTYLGAYPCSGTDEVFTDVDGALLYNVIVSYISGSMRTGSRAVITTP